MDSYSGQLNSPPSLSVVYLRPIGPVNLRKEIAQRQNSSKESRHDGRMAILNRPTSTEGPLKFNSLVPDADRIIITLGVVNNNGVQGTCPNCD